MIAIAIPAVLSVFIAIYRKSIHEIHHGLLALAAGRFVTLHEVLNPVVLTIHRAVTHLVTEALKNRIGKYQNMKIDATYVCLYSRSTSPRLSCSMSVGPVRTYLHWVRLRVIFHRISANETQRCQRNSRWAQVVSLWPLVYGLCRNDFSLPVFGGQNSWFMLCRLIFSRLLPSQPT